MAKENTGPRQIRSNGRQLGIIDRIHRELEAPELSFSAHKAEGERVPVPDPTTGVTLWSSVDPRFKK